MNKTTRTALVTGANRGIGFQTVRDLAGRGSHVVLTSRDEARGLAAHARLSAEEASRTEVLQLDVTDETSIAQAAGALASRGLRIDILINNGAITMDGFDEHVARGTLDANFYGPVRVTEALLPLVPDGGTIVMVSSGAGELSILSAELKRAFLDPSLTREGIFALMERFVAAVGAGRYAEEGWPSSAYGVSKAGLNAYVRYLAPVLAQRKIRVNAVCPGWVRTDMGGPGAPRSLEEGASSVLKAAFFDDDRTGGFFRDGIAIDW